jgi:hypothetical protein
VPGIGTSFAVEVVMKTCEIRLELVDAREWSGGGQHYRREEWTIRGGEVDPAWLTAADQRARAAGWEPSSRFTLYVVDGQVDRRVASYGGAVWPTAWQKLFVKGRLASVEITDEGLALRAAALDGASDMYADARLLP